ncbi:MAG: PAS domain S-box protein [Burkholderiales bacterium]|nr:PAS domain S-box protein [Burkholderiales bacterium]
MKQPAATGPGGPDDQDRLDAPALYRSLFAAYPDALLLVDSAGHIVLSNPEATRLLGYTEDELRGLPVDALVPEAIRPAHAAYRGAYAHRPRARAMGTQMDLRARCRDGSEVMVEIALSPLHGQGLPYVVAAVRGIGAYPRVKQALQRARYSECLAHVGRMAVDSRDPKVLIQRLAEAGMEGLQVDAAEIALLERNGLEFRTASGAGLFGAAETRGSRLPNRPDTAPGYVLATGLPLIVPDVRAEQRFVPPAAWLAQGLASVLAVPVSDRGQIIGMLAVHARAALSFGDDEVRFLQSLANLLATSLQRAQSEEDLNHAQRLESVGQLTGGIAHDFNNLLTIIQGNNQVLADHPPIQGDPHAQQLLAAGARATRRAAELTGKLLAFSRRQVLSPARVDVAAMLESLADMLQRTIEQNIRIELDLAGAAPCLADPVQLESSLLNLAINARDAMASGGVLTFSCRVLDRLPADVAEELGAASAAGDGYVAVGVSDTGIGMSESVRERAFEPFFTTKPPGRGTGLGLSTVYGFVKQSRGAVRLHSAPGAGTTLTLVLPRFAEAAAPAGGPVAGAAADPASLPPGLKVLLVEDEAEVRAVVRSFLQSLGCVVTAYTQGEPALAGLDDDAGHALLLTDVALGAGLRGTELARRAQARRPGLAVLLMSGYSADMLGGDGPRPAAMELLRKPFDRAQLAAAIGRALRARG